MIPKERNQGGPTGASRSKSATPERCAKAPALASADGIMTGELAHREPITTRWPAYNPGNTTVRRALCSAVTRNRRTAGADGEVVPS